VISIGVSAVVRRVLDDAPLAIRLGDFDDRNTMRGLALAHVVGVLRQFAVPRVIHDRAVGVLIVHREDRAVAVGEQRHAVVVVAELAFLGGAGAGGGFIELGGVGPQRIAPLRDDMPGIAVRHGDRIQRVGGDRIEAEASGGARGHRRQGGRSHHEGGGAETEASTQKIAPRHGAVHDPLKLRYLGAGIVDLVEFVEGVFRRNGVGHRSLSLLKRAAMGGPQQGCAIAMDGS
jgi:hypothetical protein